MLCGILVIISSGNEAQHSVIFEEAAILSLVVLEDIYHSLPSSPSRHPSSFYL